jgi:uncharacterized protein (TIGR03083 family)
VTSDTSYVENMTKDEMFEAVIAQRRQLANTLDGLKDDEWNAASLCAGWKVRDVVGHLVSIIEIPIGKFVLGAAKAGNFDRFADRAAREFGACDLQAIAATYRSLIDRRFAPPVIGPIAPLTDLFVHTRDIERPLGRAVTLDADAQRTVLDFLCGGKARGFVPSSRTKGLRFEATDLGWSIGSGPVVSGTGEAIMMAVSDRGVALADLTGGGLAILAQRIG